MDESLHGRTVCVATLGCKVNQFESAAFSSDFQAEGCRLVDLSAGADIYVINTCAVTGRAGQQSRQLVRRARRANPDARIIVTGCYAQIEAEQVLGLVDGPVCVVGNGNKHLVLETARECGHHDILMLTGDIGRKREVCPLTVRRFPGRTRAYLRVQDGCDNFCSYCIVPYTRGRSRSLPLAAVLEQMDIFVHAGHLEVVVTGINVGKYGLDLAEGQTIYTLLDLLCRNHPHVRIRLSSVEPTEVNRELLDLQERHANFMPHFHVPLQSGDNGILARMNRHYTTSDVVRIIGTINRRFPDAAIGCDILAGFPGEDRKAADNTYRLLADLPITYLHVFPYSRRPGTRAARFREQVSPEILNDRVRRLRDLDLEKRQRFRTSQLGTTRQVLVERKNPQTGLLQGFSENYLPVAFSGPDSLVGTVAQVLLVRSGDREVLGRYPDDTLE